MNYQRIELNDGGLKGATIFYSVPNEKGIPVKHKVYPKSVVHIALQKHFKSLRKHLLDICGQTNADMKEDIAAYYADGAVVKTIEFDGDKIFLQGEWERFSGKFIPLETCWIEESDQYNDWDELVELAEKIKEETTAYYEGSVKVTDAEAIAMWAAANHKEEEFTMDKILSLPPEELVKMATKIIERGAGGVVTLPEEFDPNNEHIDGVVEELKTEFEVSSDQVVELGSVPEKKGKKKKEETVTETNPQAEF